MRLNDGGRLVERHSMYHAFIPLPNFIVRIIENTPMIP